jgi:hypothetical protein
MRYCHSPGLQIRLQPTALPASSKSVPQELYKNTSDNADRRSHRLLIFGVCSVCRHALHLQWPHTQSHLDNVKMHTYELFFDRDSKVQAETILRVSQATKAIAVTFPPSSPNSSWSMQCHRARAHRPPTRSRRWSTIAPTLELEVGSRPRSK